MLDNVWLRQPTRTDAAQRIFCFPYAGAGGAIYRTWPQALPKDIEVCAIEPPGHFARAREQSLRSMPEFIDALDAALRPLLDRPFSLFGYSLGALVAFEWARKLRLEGARLPDQLIVSACGAPCREPHRERLSNLPNPHFLAAIERRYGDLDPALTSDPDTLDFIVRVMRADLEMVETYSCLDRTPFEFPISAIYGDDDRIAPHKAVDAWRELTYRPFRSHSIAGGHFFIRDHDAQLTSYVHQLLSSAIGYRSTEVPAQY